MEFILMTAVSSPRPANLRAAASSNGRKETVGQERLDEVLEPDPYFGFEFYRRAFQRRAARKVFE